VKKPKKVKKPKLNQLALSNLAKSKELLARVQILVCSGKSPEDPEVQSVLQELAALVQDVKASQELLMQAVSKATVTKRMMKKRK